MYIHVVPCRLPDAVSQLSVAAMSGASVGGRHNQREVNILHVYMYMYMYMYTCTLMLTESIFILNFY